MSKRIQIKRKAFRGLLLIISQSGVTSYYQTTDWKSGRWTFIGMFILLLAAMRTHLQFNLDVVQVNGDNSM